MVRGSNFFLSTMAALLLVHCSSTTNTGNDGCEPETQRKCIGDDDCVGWETCDTDGSWGECLCEGGTDPSGGANSGGIPGTSASGVSGVSGVSGSTSGEWNGGYANDGRGGAGGVGGIGKGGASGSQDGGNSGYGVDGGAGGNSPCGDGQTTDLERCDPSNDNDPHSAECHDDCSGWCGDDALNSEHEECDDGDDNGEYGLCNTSCDGLAAHCGDGIVNPPYEFCEPSHNGACRPDCSGWCGDGWVNGGEVCDDGSNDGAYNGCNDDCMSLGPHCGDGIVDSIVEACDGTAGVPEGYVCHDDCSGASPPDPPPP